MSASEARNGQSWRVVPVYALTRGRTRCGWTELPLETLVIRTGLTPRVGSHLDLEYRQLLDLATGAISIIELSAHLRLPPGVVRVLVSDLTEAGYLTTFLPPAAGVGGPDADVLERLLGGLRAQ
ncbi:MAG TPA: DUF742 domain-containing protein [Pseudonocardia sp.]